MDDISISSLIIFKDETFMNSWMPRYPPQGWKFSCNPSDWTSNAHDAEWLRRCFEPATREKARVSHRSPGNEGTRVMRIPKNLNLDQAKTSHPSSCQALIKHENKLQNSRDASKMHLMEWQMIYNEHIYIISILY